MIEFLEIPVPFLPRCFTYHTHLVGAFGSTHFLACSTLLISGPAKGGRKLGLGAPVRWDPSPVRCSEPCFSGHLKSITRVGAEVTLQVT